jgi:RimJ/RimL family protein N-acetyltransferase
MTLQEFCRLHGPALERDEARHNRILAVLARLGASAGAQADRQAGDVPAFTLGTAGKCAIADGGSAARRPPVIVIGEADAIGCRALAERAADLAHDGVLGPDHTALWFAERASCLGGTYAAPMRLRILATADRPTYPGTSGHARRSTVADVDLLLDWITAFVREAVPHERPPARERVATSAGDGRHMLWVVDGAPVATAAIVRGTRNAAAISQVYTPPALRGRGYGGAVTAAAVEQAFAAGKTLACLYVDAANPFSARCYARIGFTAVCDAAFVRRIS